ncbi:BRO family protein [uncultured Ruegeria sp.]|uniref:BRO family protein n=1 Tax=uncultured Ruegeria sp. TaxID=259304 RepID=UPI002602D229|nr:BRO family protein [uncultured Ruegeria sp.]
MNIVPFNFKNKSVRVIEIEGEPWFVGKDVALALGYSNPRKALLDHCKKAQHVGGSRFVTPPEMDPQTKIIPEGDVYRLIIRSNRPEAQEFENLVMDEILPTIRKTGSYGAPKLPTMTELAQMVIQSETEKAALVEENRKQACQIVNLEPKAQSFDSFLASDGYVNLRMAMREIGAKPHKALEYLRSERHMFSEGVNANTPKGTLISRGYFKVVPVKNTRDGKVYPQTVVSSRGLTWLDRTIPDELRIGGAA